MVSCSTDRQGGKELQEWVLHVHVCSSVHSRALTSTESTHCGPQHQGELALTVPFQGTQVKKRRAALAAVMACCTPQKLAQFLIAPLSLGHPPYLQKGHIWRGSGVKGPQDSPPANHRAGNSRWDPDWPQGCPTMFQSWTKALRGLPTIGCVTFQEASKCLQRQSGWNCSRLVSPWS